MNKHILLTLVAMSSVALNGMDVPRNGAANPATRILVPLTEEQALSMAIALSQQEEQERQHDLQIADKELELAMVLSRQNAIERANLQPHAEGFNALASDLAQPARQYDLTNPHDVIAWAKDQGMYMTYDQAREFADTQNSEQHEQFVLDQAIQASLENAPKEPAKQAAPEEAKAPTKNAAAEEAEVDDCSICLEALDKDVVPVGPNCKHMIHSACLATIKTKFTECPECRAKI